MKVAKEAGEFRSHSLMVSSQLPVKKVFLLTTFQFTQYTCIAIKSCSESSTCAMVQAGKANTSTPRIVIYRQQS